MKGCFVHPNALMESRCVGGGTRVWAFAHVMKGAVVGRNCNIGDHAFVEAGARIGDRVTLKNGAQVWEGVRIEDDVFVGPSVVFTNDMYPRSPRSKAAGKRYCSKKWLVRTLVRKGASIGANATILSGVEIGAYSMIAAGAVVVKSVPPFALAAGSPAAIRGYVCFCGQPLRSRSGALACRRCGLTYGKKGAGLALKRKVAERKGSS